MTTRFRRTFLLLAAVLASATAAAQFRLPAGGMDVSQKNGVPIRFNNAIKSDRHLYLYRSGTLNYIRYTPGTDRLDTFYFDHPKIEELAYKAAFGAFWEPQLRAIQQLGGVAQPNLEINRLSVSGDTLTAMIGVHKVANPSSPAHESVRLHNVVLMVRLVGSKLIVIEDYTGWIDAVKKSSMTADCWPLPDHAIAREGCFFMPALYHPQTPPEAKSLFRFARSGDHAFISWEKLGFPNEQNTDGIPVIPLAIWNGDYYMHTNSSRLYAFSSQKAYDLSDYFELNDTSALMGTYSDRRQVHDIQDLGNGKLALLIRHGSNLRLLRLQRSGDSMRLIDSKLVATRYPNASAGFPAFYLDEKCFAFDKVTNRFRELQQQ